MRIFMLPPNNVVAGSAVNEFKLMHGAVVSHRDNLYLMICC